MGVFFVYKSVQIWHIRANMLYFLGGEKWEEVAIEQ